MIVNVNLPVSVSAIPTPAGAICAGTPVTFTASPTNGGTTPVYQWKKNGINVGANQTTYTDATLNNNDIITCVMTSNFSCATGNPAISVPITMTVNTNLVAQVALDVITQVIISLLFNVASV